MDDIAILGFKVASNGSLAKYNLIDQTIDDFQDASGVDASASTDELRSLSNFYSGGVLVAPSGGTETTSGDYNYHSFTSTGAGSFIVPSDGSGIVEVVMIAGGGGGGWHHGGGGGAGGLIHDTSLSVTAQTYALSVGIAGTSPGGDNTVGGDGADSTGFGWTAIGGGGGGCYSNVAGNDGGSGGGGGGQTTGAGGATTQTSSGTGSSGTRTVYGEAGGPATGDTATTNFGGGAGGSGSALSISAFSDFGVSGNFAGGGGNGNSASGGSGGGGGAGAGGANYGNGVAATGTWGSGGGGGGGNYGDGAVGAQGWIGVKYLTDSISTKSDMTLVSNSTTAEAVPTKGDFVMTYTNGTGTAVIGTDLKAYVSRDAGTTYTEFTLSDEGDTGGHTILTSHDLDISGQPSGTSMLYKITTHNQSVSKETRIQAVSLGWS